MREQSLLAATVKRRTSCSHKQELKFSSGIHTQHSCWDSRQGTIRGAFPAHPDPCMTSGYIWYKPILTDKLIASKGSKGETCMLLLPLTSPTNVFISKAITGTFKIIFSSLILGLGKSMLLTESFTNLNQKYVLQPKDRIQMPPSAHHWSILRITRPWQMYTSRPQSIHLLKPPQWQLLLLSPVLPPQLCKNKENAVTALVSQTTPECYTEVW